MSPRTMDTHAPTFADLAALARAEAKNPTPPAVVRDLFAEPWGTSLDALGVVLMYSWRSGGSMPWKQGHPRPLLDLPRSEWVEMFRHVGYMTNTGRVPAMRPTEPMRLYRAATHDYRDGLSWALTPKDARVFLRSPSDLDQRLYVADVRPAWMLGRYSTMWPWDIAEVIADVPRRAIRPYVERPGEPFRVLFVCHGNICRSPLAELVLREMAAKRGLPVEVASCGVAAIDGDAMDPGTLACAARHGLDGSAHVARRFVHDDLAQHDLIVSLDARAARGPRALARALSWATARLWDRPIPNPWRRPDAEHENAYRAVVDICREVCRDARAHTRPEAAR